MESRKYLPEIWIYCETNEKGLVRGSRELLGKARSLADEAGCTVTAALFECAGREGAAQSAVFAGADKIYCFRSPDRLDEAAQVQAIMERLEGKRPWAFLFPATAYGRTVAAMLSVRLKTGLTADCMAFSVEDGFLKQIRPTFGGSLMAEVSCRQSFPQMATVHSGVFPLPFEDTGRGGQIQTITLEQGPESILLSRETAEDDGKALEDGEIVLAGGMGLRTAEGFHLLKEAARKIGAVPAASRAAVNAGLAPYAWQVGQSGKTICPKLYIACGISGAVQHMAGVQGAGRVIAVNHDRKAPVFCSADVGIYGDCWIFLERLLEIGLKL